MNAPALHWLKAYNNSSVPISTPSFHPEVRSRPNLFSSWRSWRTWRKHSFCKRQRLIIARKPLDQRLHTLLFETVGLAKTNRNCFVRPSNRRQHVGFDASFARGAFYFAGFLGAPGGMLGIGRQHAVHDPHHTRIDSGIFEQHFREHAALLGAP